MSFATFVPSRRNRTVVTPPESGGIALRAPESGSIVAGKGDSTSPGLSIVKKMKRSAPLRTEDRKLLAEKRISAFISAV